MGNKIGTAQTMATWCEGCVATANNNNNQMNICVRRNAMPRIQ